MKRALLAVALLLGASVAYARPNGPQATEGTTSAAASVVVPTTASTGFTAWTTNPGAGTATFANSAAGISLFETNYGANNINALCKSVPATPYTITGKFATTLNYAAGDSGTTGNGNAKSGFAVRNVTTGGISAAGVMATTSFGSPSLPGVYVLDFSNPTTYSGTTEWGAITWESTMRLQFSDDGTNFVWRYSMDGQNWIVALTRAKSAGYLGATGYNQICIFVSANGSDAGVTLQEYSEASP